MRRTSEIVFINARGSLIYHRWCKCSRGEAELERIVMVTESWYCLVCHQSGMGPSSRFNIPGLENALSARAEGICSFLSAPAGASTSFCPQAQLWLSLRHTACYRVIALLINASRSRDNGPALPPDVLRGTYGGVICSQRVYIAVIPRRDGSQDTHFNADTLSWGTNVKLRLQNILYINITFAVLAGAWMVLL